MLTFAGAQLDLWGIIIGFFLIAAITLLLVSMFCVLLYYTLTKKSYTRKEFWMNSLLISIILLIASGTVCGLIIM